MVYRASPVRATEPIPHATAERASPSRPRLIGRLRLPIALPYRPWARLYELPDGRRIWCVRLWEIDQPVRRCFSTGLLLAFARLNRFDHLAQEIRVLAAQE
jgi:hypothetical protein